MALTRQGTALLSRLGSPLTPDEQRNSAQGDVYRRVPFEVQAYWAGGSKSVEDMAIVESYYNELGEPVPPRPRLADLNKDKPVTNKVIRKKGSEPAKQGVIDVVLLAITLLSESDMEAVFRRLGDSLGYDVE